MTSAAPTLDFARFVAAQDADGTYRRALGELCAGRKSGHWMWFVFPQLVGLGASERARCYALHSVEAAAAYLADPLPGGRLREATRVVLGLEGRTALEIFGETDERKFHSCMTLFALAESGDGGFRRSLEKFFGGAEDLRTLTLLGMAPPRDATTRE